MKKTCSAQVAICLLLAFTLLFGNVCGLLGYVNWTGTAFAQTADAETQGVVRPEDIDEGLSVNDLQDIRGRRVTIRQPVMEVLQSDIPRPHVEELSNVYQMLDFTDGSVMHDLAKIDFGADESRQPGNKDHPMYPMEGLARSPKDDDGNVTSQPYFSLFTKYMLLRQAYYFNTHATQIINDGELKKHPAADYIYGKIPDDAKAVTMHIVTDPIYRSPMTTGLYLAPGETVTVKIKGLKQGETVSLYTHHQDTMGYLGYDETGKGFGSMEKYLAYWDEKIVQEARRAEAAHEQPDFENTEKFNYGIHGQWMWQNQKVPCMGTTFNIVGTGNDTEVKIGSMYGGPLYIKPTNSAVDLEISGAILTPHFVLGVTTVEEFEQQLRDAPGLIATLDVENGQLIGPAQDMRNCDDIEKLAYFWHSVFAIDISLNGREYNYNMTMCYDMHVPAGEAVALNSNFCAQPSYWFDTCMNYEELTTKGNWGTFHELGHVQAKTHGVNWGFCDGDGEVWNNTLILLIYSMLCNMDSRVVGVEHGEYVHPYTAIVRSQNITQNYTDKTTGEVVKIDDYGKINEGNGAHFDQLSMYATLLHSFGPQKFVDMFYTYKMNPAYCANKRADFVYRIGLVDRVNILDWVNGNYFANISNDMFSDSQLEFLRNLPKFVPVAYRWANGIDGNETARKYDADGKYPTVFDLSGENITSPGKVDIVGVTNARYGTADYDPNTLKVTYTPPKTATEYDSFDIIVRTEGGRQVTLNVNMSLVYNGSHTEVWQLADTTGSRPQVQNAIDMTQGRNADYTLSNRGVNLPNFNNGAVVEYFKTACRFEAPSQGQHTFYLRSDDAATVNFTQKGTVLGSLKTTTYTAGFSEGNKLVLNLEKGEVIDIEIHLVNWGGQGNLYLGYKAPNSDKITDLPEKYIINPAATDEDIAAAKAFKGWQPQFVDSIKDATIDYQMSNSGWKVLSCPDSETGLDGSKMVDGDESTIYHSRYNGVKATVPHVFVIDTGANQTFNYFDVIRRTTGNDKLIKFELYSCTESQYNSAGTGTNHDGWTQLFAGASTNVNAARQRITFDRTEVRYFKFVVTDNNNGHTVIREVYAGIQSQLSQTVKPSNYVTQDGNKGFEENAANGKLTADAPNASYTFRFLGNGFDVFADTDPNYGTATISVDGVIKETIDLNDAPLFNKQVYTSGELPMAEHTVVVTVQNAPFNISFVNVRYGTPVAADEYPALRDANGNEDYGNTDVARQFDREWKTTVKDYAQLTSIKFTDEVPQGYEDTYVRMDKYIRLYRRGTEIAFVYPGKILAPIECGSLFAGCESLVELVLDNFDTTYMRGAMSMFYDCKSIESLDLNRLQTQNVLSYGKMFGNCTKLRKMDLSHFELDEKANLYRIFENCADLQTITLPQKAVGETTFDLPYVYCDEQTNTFGYTFTLNEQTAGHTLVMHTQHNFDGSSYHKRVDPQCTTGGNVDYYTCTQCQCNFADQTNGVLLRGDEILLAELGHDFDYDYPTDLNDIPTCTEPGICGAYRCTRCGFEQEGVTVWPALGHAYRLDTDNENALGKGYTIDFGTDGKATVTFYLVCQLFDWGENVYCEHQTKVVVTVDYDTHQQATCTEEESYFYDAVIDKGMLEREIILQDDEDDVVDGMYSFNSLTISGTAVGEEATGHTMQVVAAIPATCEYSGSTAGKVCAVCGYAEDVTSIAPLNHDMQPTAALEPTCTTAGHSAGMVCTRCGKLGSGVESKPALDHDFSVEIQAVQPTCTEVGHTAGKKCSRCEAIEGCDIVDDLGHDEVIVKGTPATETQAGLTDGTVCARCGEVLTAQKEIPPLGSDVGVDNGNAPADGTLAIVLGIVGGAAVLAAVVTTAIILLRRRKRQ